MQSADWKNIFDTSVLPKPTQVVGHANSVMFICEDDSVYCMGNDFAEADSRGWLHKIEKPDDCRDYLKVFHSRHFRMIVTKDSKIFVHGKNFDDIFNLKDSSANAEKAF